MVWFNFWLNTSWVILDTIFRANHLTGAKNLFPTPITWLVLVN